MRCLEPYRGSELFKRFHLRDTDFNALVCCWIVNIGCGRRCHNRAKIFRHNGKQNIMANKFADSLTGAIDGLKIEMYPNNQLGDYTVVQDRLSANLFAIMSLSVPSARVWENFQTRVLPLSAELTSPSFPPQPASIPVAITREHFWAEISGRKEGA